ncbi:MAG TPA: T9SS type A sorting domain-containing protein, partial [Saprospiraceae bacterium]|nr:T9SS type A sorting domain-containing protein [Saprospiraceae bacterium]
DTVSIADSLPAGILYVVTVTGAGGCTAVTSAGIVDYSTAYWYLKLYKECVDSTGIPNGNLYLRFNNGGGIAFPALVSWSDGTTRLIPESPPSGYLDTLAGVTSGYYSATVTDADGCAVSTQTVLNCTPPPPVPDSMAAFYIFDEYVTPQYQVDSCIGVFARHFNEVYSLQFTLSWDTSLMAIKPLQNLNSDLTGLSVANFNINPEGSLQLSWSDPFASGVSLPENSRLFEVCYTPKVHHNYVRINFTEGRLGTMPTGDAPFLGKNGYVLFGLYFPAGPSVCEFAAIPSNCVSDGHARILLDGCDVGDPVFGEYSHNGVYYNDLSGLMFADSGSYQIYAYQNAQSSNTFYAYIPGTSDSSSCVWPGDADDNNAVNHHDLLYIGLAYGATGAQRSGADLNWAGQECADWPLTTVNRHINYKNIDANGDGTVDAADTLAIVQNWSRVVNPAKDNPFDAPLGNPTGNPDPPFTIETDTLSPGQMATLPLLLGSADMPVDSIYGLAFSISYDPVKVHSNISFQPSDSWLGDSSQMLWLQRNFPGQGRLDVAITRTDGMPVSGWGHIGDVFVIIEDDIFFAAGINEESEAEFFVDSVAKTTLFFSGLHPVNTTAAPGMLHAPPVELVILKTSSTAQEPAAWENKLSISPNPAAESIRISSPESMIRRVEMIDPTGTIVMLHNVSAGNITVPVHALSNGTYFVRIFTEQGVAVRKICVTR